MLWFPMFKRMDIRGSHGALAKDEGWIVLEIMVGKLEKLPMFIYDGRMSPWAYRMAQGWKEDHIG